ncbi:MAG: hypothetical protein JAY72_20550 [Candidatus Thiodiazotropha endolucinida]|nr:hypothetical protein [Candidatus Thiodiazotropha taylori]MCW4324073.1 hypothetical protein [Candidatus Thiodiazotropha taylori]
MEAEAASDIEYFEAFDFRGRLLHAAATPLQLRYSSYQEDIVLLDPFSGDRKLYSSAGLTRSPIKLDDRLSVSSMTISFYTPNDNSFFREFLSSPRKMNYAIGSTVLVRRIYVKDGHIFQTEGALFYVREMDYKTVFSGKISAMIVESATVDSGGLTEIKVTDEWVDWSLSLNKRTYSRMCGFIFKGSQCKYQGHEPFCDKTLISCSEFGNEQNFGGFKNIDEVVRSGDAFL